MKAHVAIENGKRQGHRATAVSEAIQWLQSYINENPYTDAAGEARNIIYGLETVQERPALDELIALIGQIAKSDLGLKEINRAKIRIGESRRTSAKPEVGSLTVRA